jgi:RNase P protein component
MLSKQNRATSADIATLFTKAKPAGMPFFVARYMAKPGKSQFAVIAPKTVAKGAVLRNSLRRKWSAALRAALLTTTPPSGLYAFTLKKEATDISLPDRTAALISYFKKFHA